MTGSTDREEAYREKMSEWLTVIRMSTQDGTKLRDSNGLWFSGDALVSAAVQCVMVGMRSEAEQALNEAHSLLSEAIEREEKPNVYFPYLSESQLHFDLAICNWLLHDNHDDYNFGRYVAYMDEYLKSTKAPKRDFDDILPEYLAARQFARILEIYVAAFKRPLPNPLRATPGSAPMAAMIAAFRQSKLCTTGLILDKLTVFLQRFLPTTFPRGGAIKMATWIKIRSEVVGIGSSAMDALLMAKEFIVI